MLWGAWFFTFTHSFVHAFILQRLLDLKSPWLPALQLSSRPVPCFPADLNRDLPESDRHKGMACMPSPVRSPGITSTAPDEPATAALAKQQVKASNIAQEQITCQYISPLLPCCQAALQVQPDRQARCAAHSALTCCMQMSLPRCTIYGAGQGAALMLKEGSSVDALLKLVQLPGQVLMQYLAMTA